MNIEFSALWIHQHAPGGIFDKKRYVKALISDLFPVPISARTAHLPCHCAIVVAAFPCDSRRYCPRSFSKPVDFHQPYGSTSYPGRRCVENNALVPKHAEATTEQKYT